MKKILSSAIFIFLSFLSNAQCSQILDQSQTAFDTGTAGTDQWQSFIPSINGKLTQVNFYLNGIQTLTVTLEVRDGTGSGGTLIYTNNYNYTGVSNEQTMAIPIGTAPTLISGNTYTIRFTSGTSIGSLARTPNVYPNGIHYSSVYGFAYADMWFKTFMTPTNAPTISITAQTNVSCFGFSDGSITTNVGGGNGGNTFLWTPTGGTLQNTSGLVANTYTVTVTDMLGCTGQASTVITQPPQVTMTDPANQTVCAGSFTSAVNFSGATTYSWTNNTPSIGLAASGTGNIASFTAINTSSVPVTATITVTPSSGGCAGVQQTFTITVNPTPTVSDPADQAQCNGFNTATVFFSGTVVPTLYNWTNSQPSIGIGASGLGTIASFTAINTGTSPVIANLVVTPNANGCIGAAQSFTITVFPTPSVTDPGDQTVCTDLNTAAIIYTGPVAGTTFSWTNDTPSIGLATSGSGNIASFTAVNTGPAAVVATLIVTPTANGCNGASETFTITVNPSPNVFMFPFPDFCQNESAYTMNEGSPIGPGGVYSGNGVTGGTFDPATAGPGVHAVEYVYTDGNGCADSATLNITVFATPVVTFDALPDFCEDGATYTLSEGSPSGGAYSGTGVAGGVFDPATAGDGVHNLTYTFTDGNGCTEFANQTISVNALPVVDFDSVPNLCANDVPYVLVEGSPGGGTYSGVGISAGVFDPNSTGPGIFTANYSYTDVNGCTNNNNQNITVFDIPLTDFSALTDICQNAAIYTLTEGSPIGGIYSGTGISGDDFDPLIAGPGTHTLTYTFTDSNSCTKAATEDIVVLAIPTVTASADETICVGDVATISVTGSADTYSWDNGLGAGISFNVSPGSTTPYIVSGLALNGCTASDVVSIVVNPLPNVTFSTLADVCISSAPFSLSGGSPAGGTYTGSGVTAGVFDPAVAGFGTHVMTYTFTETGTGCTNFATSNIFVYNAPTVIANASDAIICDGGTVLLYGSGASTYSWDNGVTDSVAFAQVVGTITYTLTGIDVNGCQNTDQIDITVNPLPIVNAGLDTTICENGIITLSGSGATTYSWNNAVTNNLAFTPPVGTTTYIVVGTDSNSCQNSDDITVTVNPLPILTLSPDQIFCLGDTITLEATGAISFDWNSGAVSANTFAIAPTNSTTIQVSGTSNGCTTIGIITLTLDDPTLADAGNDVTICAGFTTYLIATGGVSYLWNGPGVNNITDASYGFQVDTTAYYHLTAITANGCAYTDSVFVTASIDPSCVIEPLTTFSPNGDAVNESWNIQGINSFPGNHVTVLNRWGDIVFDADNYDNETIMWEGTLPNGSEATEGTYFYIIELTDGPSSTGWIQLLK